MQNPYPKINQYFEQERTKNASRFSKALLE